VSSYPKLVSITILFMLIPACDKVEPTLTPTLPAQSLSTHTEASPPLEPTLTPSPTEFPAEVQIASSTEVPTEEPTDTTSPTPHPIQFTYFTTQNNSILPPTDIRDLNGTYQDPGAVIFHDGQFHLFYNSSNSYPPKEVHIGYVVSTDGYTWERVTYESIIHEEDIPYEVSSILAGGVIVEPDGTWVLYFYTRDNSRITPPSRIGRATAPAPAGPWKVDPNPVLEPG